MYPAISKDFRSVFKQYLVSKFNCFFGVWQSWKGNTNTPSSPPGEISDIERDIDSNPTTIRLCSPDTPADHMLNDSSINLLELPNQDQNRTRVLERKGIYGTMKRGSSCFITNSDYSKGTKACNYLLSRSRSVESVVRLSKEHSNILQLKTMANESIWTKEKRNDLMDIGTPIIVITPSRRVSLICTP